MHRVIQLNTLEDRNVTDKAQWDSAMRFLEKSLHERLEGTEANLRQQVNVESDVTQVTGNGDLRFHRDV